MLETALAEDLTPSSNLPSAARDTLWVHLLPDLEPLHVGWFGPPDAEVVTLLVGAGRMTVTDLTRDLGWVRALPGRLRRRHLSRVRALFLQSPMDLVLLPARAAASMARHPTLLEGLTRVLTPDAVVGIIPDLRSGRRGALPRRDIDRIAASLAAGALAELSTGQGVAGSPSGGLAIPLPRRRVWRRSRARLRRAVLIMRQRVAHARGRGPSRLSRTHASDITLLRPVLAGRSDTPRRGVVLLRRNCGVTDVPEYLVHLAAGSGVELSGARWAVAPPRGYRSQKVIFSLERQNSTQPDLMVKMTQEPRFNYRLDNERRALELLADVSVADELTVPRVAFAGTHGGLLVVGETALAGDPFRVRSTAVPDCPVAASAIEWLTALGAETMHSGPDRGPVWPSLRELADRYLAMFVLAPGARRNLDHHLQTLAASSDEIPAVVSHGDPGTWNLLVRPSGGVCFLDWENAESAGMPGWDLLQFLKTFANFSSGVKGVRRSTENTLELLCRAGPINDLVKASLRAYGDRLGIDRELLTPLLLMCWVHQSLKEATRLPPGSQDRNRSHQLVTHCLDEPTLLWAMTGP
jgi:hypothetical protein